VGRAVRTHFEAWCKAWGDIGRAHALGLFATNEALRRAHRDSLIYGEAWLRVTASGRIERVDPREIIRHNPEPAPAAPAAPWWSPLTPSGWWSP